MPIKKYFTGDDMLPLGLEKSLTYSEADDTYLFKRQRARIKDIYTEIIARIRKNVDPDCHYRDIQPNENPVAHVSLNMLFYLVTYFYCRFCFLSPYHRPQLAMRQSYEGKNEFTISIGKDVYQNCPNRELLLRKATYLATVCGFPLTVEENGHTAILCFCLTPEKKSSIFIFSALAFARVDRFVKAAISAAKADGTSTKARHF